MLQNNIDLYKREASELMILNFEELLEKLGDEISGDNFFPLSKNQKIKEAKKWLDKKLPLLKQEICNNQTLKDILNGDEIVLAALTADVIATKWHLNSPVTIAVLVVKIGLKKICN